MRKDSVGKKVFIESSILWIKLVRDRRWSRRQKHELLSVFGSPKLVYQASLEEQKKAVSGRLKYELDIFDADDLDRMVEQDLCWLKKEDANFITYHDAHYPRLLKQIDDPPLALFTLGDISYLNHPQIAIVGSRRPTPVGSKVARQFAQELSNLGIVITSGMALGVDGLGHDGALEQGNPTIAVMGCGLDVIYPARHKRMFDQIRNNGLLVSEYPLGVKPSKYTFPERNRIVSGLSIGVVIIEAAIRSGTLITARLAMEQNREVMVLPGAAVSAQYQGSHVLIRDGAALVTNVEEILFVVKEQLANLNFNSIVGEQSSSKSERMFKSEGHPLLSFIGAESVSMETLIMNSQLTAAEVSSMLLVLELEGKVAMGDDGGYVNIG